MKNIKKKSLIAVIAIIMVLGFILSQVVSHARFTDSNAYITDFNFDKWQIKGKMGISKSKLQTSEYWKFVEGFQLKTNMDFYCIERGQKITGGEFQIVAKIAIDGGKITSAEILKEGNVEKLTPRTDENAKEANRILARILYNATLNKDSRNRKMSGFEDDVFLDLDKYQWAIWNYLDTWSRNSIGEPNPLGLTGNAFQECNYCKSKGINEICKEQHLKWDSNGNITGYSCKNHCSGECLNSSLEIRQANYTATKVIIPREEAYVNTAAFGVSISKVGSNTKLEDKRVEGNYTYLGPFTYNYSGEVIELTAYYNDNVNNVSSSKAIVVDEGGTFVEKQVKELPNGKPFYIRVLTSELEGKQKVNLLTQVTGQANQKATIYILKNTEYNGQRLMYANATASEDTKTSDDPYEIAPTTGTVKILKQNANGNPLRGIKFEIYDSNNSKVGELTTDKNGSTNPIELNINQVYQIRETKADIYGYKRAAISENNISILHGEIVGKVENGVANFKLTDKEALITIDNVKELANLQIIKEGKDKAVLSDVSFVIEANDGEKPGFLQLFDTNGKLVDSIAGAVTINSNNTATIDGNTTEYRVDVKVFKNEKDSSYKDISELTSEELSQLTEFRTNVSGLIKIDNLEIYASKSSMFNYTAHERENNRYGYDVSTNTQKSVNIGGLSSKEDNTIRVTIPNEQYLGDLKIVKKDKNHTNIVLPNVEFIIEQDVKNTHAFLALYDENGKLITKAKESIVINNTNKAQANPKEYRVEYKTFKDANGNYKEYSQLTDAEKAEITTFVTGNSGTLEIKNMEVYSKYSENGKPVKYQYNLKETKNNNQGYDIDTVSGDLNVTLTEGKVTEGTILNEKNNTTISGYVWIERPTGKENTYD